MGSLPEILKATAKNANLIHYEQERKTFNWKDVEENFTWFNTGKVNIVHEAVDRHVEEGRGNKLAFVYSDPERNEQFTYDEMRRKTNRAANVFRKFGIQKGDRVIVFMPRSPEMYFSILGAIKIGAIVVPLFESFMESAIKDRILDSQATTIVTTPKHLLRIPSAKLPDLQHVFLVNDDTILQEGQINFRSEMAKANEEAHTEWVDREDGMLLHYTSGSTGTPKGVYLVHNNMIQHFYTGKIVLDFKEDDVYWCTADPGWVIGTSYGIFAPWLCGVTNVVRGGRFSPSEWYATLQNHRVTIWHSAPTAFRMLMGAGDDMIEHYDLASLRHILSVGEPLNSEVIRWGMRVFNQRIHDTWWMTETGAQMICNYPCMDMKLGSMGKPIPGIEAAIIDDQGNVLPPNRKGNLAIKTPWPAMMRKIWNNPTKYEQYFKFSSWYITGDSAYVDEDGYFFFQGRVDDMINTAGERIEPFEVESKLLEHEAIAEAGVIGKPDPVRGEVIKAFISLKQGYEPSEQLKNEITQFVETSLSAHAAPREIEFNNKLPKTRSGKIMRRALKSWEMDGRTGDLPT